jgi:phosphoribosylformimino-5-aminoimidazole carboxamide ribotide isomerase
MAEFHLYPAIDIQKGQVVRLERGDPARATIFGDDPLDVARRWAADGAQWLHVVNLDGAFGAAGGAVWALLPELAALGVRVQLGGGLRSLKDVALALGRGAARVVLGTVAVEEPDVVEEAVRRFGPERVAVGIDARDGRVRTRGWQADTAVSPTDLGLEMMALGVRTVIYTDISRDGVLTGVNAAACADLARETGLFVIASGGVATLDDVRAAGKLADQGVSGLIIGRALYAGNFSLPEALAVCEKARHER